jgi:hypothetical protein
LSWFLGITLVLAWRRERVGAWVLVLATLGELGWLYYTSTTVWGWGVSLPEQSRVLARLAREPSVERVAGLVHNLPIRAGATPFFPYTGFAPPPPHPFLDRVSRYSEAFSPAGRAILERYGVSHGIWDGPVPDGELVTLLEGSDPVLDRLVVKPPGAPASATWRLVRHPTPFPPARVAIRTRIASQESSLASGIMYDPDPQTVWYRTGDQPASVVPPAKEARVVSYDGRITVVEHDGSCDLILNRTFYPGWFARVNGGAELAVSRAELGIQCAHLDGKGPSRVELSYRPNGQNVAWSLSIGATSLAILALLIEAFLHLRNR